MSNNYYSASASISEDGVYRYRLVRTWTHSPGKVATFVMFNPSTADATLDDQTIRRCVGYAQREKCDALKVVNLFAYRSTDPAALLSVPDPVGPQNDHHLRLAIAMATHNKWPLVAAWGGLADRLPAGHVRAAWFRQEAKHQRATVLCLGVTRAGSPLHPSRLSKDAELVPWQ